MAEDLFGNDIAPENLDADTGDTDLPEVTDLADDVAEDEDIAADDDTQDTLADYARGAIPSDPTEAHKYWQAAVTRMRQGDREKYGKVQEEHGQYKNILAQFYESDDYAKQVLAQRFPDLAPQIRGTGQPARSQNSTTPTGLTSELEQNLGDYGFLAQAIGPALERVIESQVQARIAPLEQRTTQQANSQRQTQEQVLLSDMDAKHPGWEESYGAKMRDLDDFLASDALSHPVYGSKYELYHRLLNPDTARVDAAREMGEASRKRTSLSRSGRQSAPNVQDEVRKTDLSNAEAFQLAARAASEETS